MFRKVLVANRGEVAIRVMRACRELGIKTVAVYSEADRESLHVRYADESYCIGPPLPSESYLNIRGIIATTKASESEAIHPGYGFLAQIPAFAEACESEGIELIGPSSKALRKLSNKVTARRIVAKAGVPVILGSMTPLQDKDEALKVAEEVGYPVLVKAVYGGGGRGLRLVRDEGEVNQAVELARLEAESSFGSPQLYVEKLLDQPRHIEFQILGDKKGNLVHLGERECSIQRRYQKLMEETPSPMMTEELREVVGEMAIKAAKAANCTSVLTAEFLVDKQGEFHFLETNTRLQVEHLITEMVTGVDIVKEQIRMAAGEELQCKQETICVRGHAINCRVNSEDPYRDFVPCPGTVTRYLPPGGPGIRVDSALYSGYTIPVSYDSLIAKLAAWGTSRNEAISRLQNALNEYVIDGVKTTIPFQLRILGDKHFRKGEVHTGFVNERIRSLAGEEEHEGEEIAALSAVLAAYLTRRGEGLAVIPRRASHRASAWKHPRIGW